MDVCDAAGTGAGTAGGGAVVEPVGARAATGAGAGTGIETGLAVTTTCGACCEELTTGLVWTCGLDGCCWTTGCIVGFLGGACCGCCGCCSAWKLEGILNEGGVVWRIGDSVVVLKGIWCLKSELMSRKKLQLINVLKD